MHESGWHSVGPVEGFGEGMRSLEIAGELVLLVRTGPEFHAVHGICPHKFGRLEEGRLAGRELTCPIHTATFDLGTGRPQPGQEWAGMLPVYATRVREGNVEIRLA